MGIGCGEGEEGFTDLPIVRFTDWVFSIFDLGFMIGLTDGPIDRFTDLPIGGIFSFLSWFGPENHSPALREYYSTSLVPNQKPNNQNRPKPLILLGETRVKSLVQNQKFGFVWFC
jgi:hypothetical protein